MRVPLLAFAALLSGCVTTLPVGTEQSAPFEGANTVTVRSTADTPEAAIVRASAVLVADGWAVQSSSAVTLTTDWRQVRRSLLSAPTEARMMIAVLAGPGGPRLVVRGQGRGRTGNRGPGAAVDLSASGRDPTQRPEWEMVSRTALLLGQSPVYGRR